MAKETRKQIVEQTRNRLAVQYNKIIAQRDSQIESLKVEILRLGLKVAHQADHITRLIDELKELRENKVKQ